MQYNVNCNLPILWYRLHYEEYVKISYSQRSSNEYWIYINAHQLFMVNSIDSTLYYNRYTTISPTQSIYYSIYNQLPTVIKQSSHCMPISLIIHRLHFIKGTHIILLHSYSFIGGSNNAHIYFSLLFISTFTFIRSLYFLRLSGSDKMW